MALFKFRKRGDESTAAAAAPPVSIEDLRRRARHRLIGATVLVVLAVVGFPLLFDTQPRPIPVDIPIDIPDRNKAKPLAVPAPAVQAPVVSGPVTAAPSMAVPAPAAPPPGPARPGVAEADKPAPPRTEAPLAKVEARPEPAVVKTEPKAEAKTETAKAEPRPAPSARPQDGARAKALLEGTTIAEPAGDGRFVVQVGAFADPDKARETRLKVERSGLKTYTHVAETKEGKRIRVRVGPFATKAEADRAAEKIKGLDLPAAILTL